jgi:hypothetical protein
MGDSYPQAKDFNVGNISNSKHIGHALTVLTNMSSIEFGTEKDEVNSTTYDMSEVDYEDLCGVVEALTEVNYNDF